MIPAPREITPRESVHALDLARRSLAFAARLGSPLVSVAVPAPWIAIEHFGDPAEETSVLWAPENGEAVAGVGVAHRLRARGDDRFAELVATARPLRGLRTLAPPDRAWASRPLRFYGGVSFVPSRGPSQASSDLWAGFGDADFVAPRWLYQQAATLGEAALSLTVTGHEIRSERGRRRRLEELEEGLERLASTTPPPVAPAPRVVASHAGDPDAFVRSVERLRRRLRTGPLQKAVLARARRLDLDAAVSAVDVLARLRPRAGATRFAFGRDGDLFLGVTPERLVRRHGARVASEALAGTASEAEADALLASTKDRHEHRLVVDALVEALAPLCASLLRSPEPTVRRLPGLAHLHTPIRGRLHRPRHVLELVERLHPTPAVGGSPSADALRFLAENEGIDRGWYAAPVGFFDTRGNGDFHVALRCGLQKGKTLHAWAGAGIVEASEPLAELREIERKQASFLDALGVDPEGSST